MEKPIGIFDMLGHGYCIYCGEDIPINEINSYEYDAIECEICNQHFMSVRLKDNDNKNGYIFI